MKKLLYVFLIITMITSVFAVSVNAIIPITESPAATTKLVEATTLAILKNDAAGSFIAVKYDTDYTNGVAVNGIGGKSSTDESIQVFSRVKTAGLDKFRIDINLLTLAGYYLYGTFVAPDAKYVEIMKNIAHNAQ